MNNADIFWLLAQVVGVALGGLAVGLLVGILAFGHVFPPRPSRRARDRAHADRVDVWLLQETHDGAPQSIREAVDRSRRGQVH